MRLITVTMALHTKGAACVTTKSLYVLVAVTLQGALEHQSPACSLHSLSATAVLLCLAGVGV